MKIRYQKILLASTGWHERCPSSKCRFVVAEPGCARALRMADGPRDGVPQRVQSLVGFYDRRILIPQYVRPEPWGRRRLLPCCCRWAVRRERAALRWARVWLWIWRWGSSPVQSSRRRGAFRVKSRRPRVGGAELLGDPAQRCSRNGGGRRRGNTPFAWARGWCCRVRACRRWE